MFGLLLQLTAGHVGRDPDQEPGAAGGPGQSEPGVGPPLQAGRPAPAAHLTLPEDLTDSLAHHNLVITSNTIIIRMH